jgi:hypothetical protein
MLEEFSVVEKIVEEVLIDLMTKRVILMSTGVQASLKRTIQASPSTAHAEPDHPDHQRKREPSIETT